MSKFESFQESVSFSRTRKDRLPRVIAILSSRASQPIAQSKTGASHSTFFFSFCSVDPPLPFSAFQIAPAVVPISPCIRRNSFPFDRSRLDITETASKTPFGRNRASHEFPPPFQTQGGGTALGSFQHLNLCTFRATPPMQDGVLVCRRPVLPTTVMKLNKTGVCHDHRVAAHIPPSRISKAETESPGLLPGYPKKGTECQEKDQTH